MRKIVNKIILIALCGHITVAFSNSESPIVVGSHEYYFNQKVDFDVNVIKPQQSLGNTIGEWHIRPDQSYSYFKQLEQSSSKVSVEQIGRSHENRPLLAVYISSPANISKLAQLKQARSSGKDALIDYQGPNIVYLGYSVHGNEASGANAAPLVAYRLAASKEVWVQELLDKNIVIIDPMLNPDGLDRFANWVNRYKGKQLVKDSNSVEHNEAWPSGRTNHYWFDLNRDWLLLQHPESQARSKIFYQWRPHIVGDFHEMGTNATYFFQPGVPSRQNPLTSKANFDLTNQIASYHAKALDKLNSSYYSKESFDDFYYGKGSTFPDINGGVGILFEQASSRGHIQESINGDLSFPFAIRNHIATSFSTLRASLDMNEVLANYQKDFFKSVEKKALKDQDKAVIFTSSDQGRLQEMLRLLSAHKIEVERLSKNSTLNNKLYTKESSYIVKFKQTQYGLIKAIFETRTEFTDNTFYDVSAWTFPLALNLEYDLLNYQQLTRLSLIEITTSEGFFESSKNPAALIFSSDNFNSSKLLAHLLKNQVTIKLATKSFSLEVNNKLKQFSTGSFIVPLTEKNEKLATIVRLWEEKGKSFGVNIYGVDSGFSLQGVDIGSPSHVSVDLPKPLLLIGNGISSYEAGEVWHLLDTRVELPVAMQPAANIGKIDLQPYTHLLLVNGTYPELDEKQKEALIAWVTAGGNIIASRGALKWLSLNESFNFSLKEQAKVNNQNRPYSQRDDVFAESIIGGAIYHTELDTSHPLTYGLGMSYLPVTKAGTQALKPTEKEFITVATYSDQPLIAGYSSKQNIDHIKNTPAILAQSLGRGTIVVFNDNSNFRGYWLGSAKLYINSLFMNNAF